MLFYFYSDGWMNQDLFREKSNDLSTNKIDLLIPILVHMHMSISQIYTLVCCILAYGNGYELKLHIMKHFKLQPFQCDYPGCSWSFVTAFKLKRHKETHSKKKDFLCTYNDCSKAFSTAYNLRVHMKAHGRPCDNVCSVCSQGFASANQLQLHIGR